MPALTWDQWQRRPSPEQIAEWFWTFPDKGIVLWKKRHGRAKALDQAGTVHADGYRYITIKLEGVTHQLPEHHLIWMVSHGYWPMPDVEIDHSNRVRWDNRWPGNLRIVSHKENAMNRDNRGNGHRFHVQDPSDF